ncbi:MAG: response regulator, partial [Proteobacteria bacterium]|nr:response regulator [Pseudomonadota bacterium]
VRTYPIQDKMGKSVACVHIASDITEEKTLKEQLLHAEKVTSIGKFVAGIAHELNNPLMGIMGFSQILMDSSSDKPVSSPDIQDKLQKIYNESLRSAKIVQNLLTFSRSKKITKTGNNLNSLIRETLENRDDALKTNNIEVSLNLDNELPSSMIDHYQMQQVFINIINNAIEAMAEANKRGTLQITSRKVDQNLIASFTDDGPGIDEEHIHNVIDPFFTTKSLGKGTGLGLSITHGIIVEHGGTLEIESPSQSGTTITVTLPYEEDVTKAFMDSPQRTKTETESVFADKKVLIADDETSIREVLAELLSAEGFIVQTAADGEQALNMVKSDAFDLIITDIRMPNLSGPELYDIIVNELNFPKENVVILTGDVLSDEAKSFLLKSNCHYILKPFNPGELLKVLHKALTP